ncbi:hypothetical protein ACFL0H_12990 [Thermodesulfobacteriota bacterium]
MRRSFRRSLELCGAGPEYLFRNKEYILDTLLAIINYMGMS